MNRNNSIKIACVALSMGIYGGGTLHGAGGQSARYSWRQQINEKITQLKDEAKTIMSQDYVIPRPIVWGGVAALTGVVVLYVRQSVSMHNIRNELLTGGTSRVSRPSSVAHSTGSQVDRAHSISDEVFRKADTGVQRGLRPRFELLAKHNDVINGRTCSMAYDQRAQELSTLQLFAQNQENVTIQRTDLVSLYSRAARTSRLLSDVVFPTLQTLDKIASVLQQG